MSTSGKTLNEILESMTGFDELAIDKHLGIDVFKIAASGEKALFLQRAMIFVNLRHSGVTDTDAYKQSMEMSVKQTQDYFEADTDIDPEGDEDSESGKGAAGSVSAPVTSLPSAS